jgi:endonuclease/exonuclease/phosphatase family metal-dependent hydrolase
LTRMSEIRVVTFNIWNRSGPWDERFIAIKTGLARLEPDLVGLQEVIVTEHGDKLDQGKAIAESLGFHMVFGSSHGEGYSFGNAVLSRWPILRHEVFPLPALDDTEPRTLLYAEVDAPAGKIPFFVTHLAWRLHEGHVRQAQVVAIAERVAALCPPHGFPPVLVGDFNAEPESDEIRFLRGHTSLGRKCVYFADAFRVAGDGSPGATFSKKNPFAEPLREPERRIDYIFVRGPDDRGRGEALLARVCLDEPLGGVFASDHFGVFAALRA